MILCNNLLHRLNWYVLVVKWLFCHFLCIFLFYWWLCTCIVFVWIFAHLKFVSSSNRLFVKPSSFSDRSLIFYRFIWFWLDLIVIWSLIRLNWYFLIVCWLNFYWSFCCFFSQVFFWYRFCCWISFFWKLTHCEFISTTNWLLIESISFISSDRSLVLERVYFGRWLCFGSWLYLNFVRSYCYWLNGCILNIFYLCFNLYFGLFIQIFFRCRFSHYISLLRILTKFKFLSTSNR